MRRRGAAHVAESAQPFPRRRRSGRPRRRGAASRGRAAGRTGGSRLRFDERSRRRAAHPGLPQGVELGPGRLHVLEAAVRNAWSAAHPRWRLAKSDSTYAGASANASPRTAGASERPSARAAEADQVEERRCDVEPRHVGDTRPPGTPGPATSSGTRTVASYTKTPCVSSPWSPRLSPWSAVTSTRALAGWTRRGRRAAGRAPGRRTRSLRRRRAWRSARRTRRGGSYGACGSK